MAYARTNQIYSSPRTSVSHSLLCCRSIRARVTREQIQRLNDASRASILEAQGCYYSRE
jgi:hypothetical protein